MDNSPIKIAQWVSAKTQDGNGRWIMITKTIMDVNLNLQNSHSSLPTEDIYQGKRPHRPVANLPVADFPSRPREMLLLKLLNTYISVFFFVYWFFFFVYWFSFPSRKVLTSLSVSDMDFSFLAAIIRENSHKLLLKPSRLLF